MTEVIPKLIDHTPGEAVKENVVAPTCQKAGSYDMVTRCTVCGAELKRESFEVDKLEHIPGEEVKENEVAATCETEGGYDLVIRCTVPDCGTIISTKHVTIPKHTPGEAVKENVVDATCQKAGSYDLVTRCTVCGAELDRVSSEVAKLDHTPGEPVIEKEIPATYLETGSYDSVVYCTKCGTELSRTSVEVPTLEYTPRGKSIPLEPATTRAAEEPTRPAPAPVPVPGLQRPAAPAAPAGTPAQPAVVNFEIAEITDVDAAVEILLEDFTRAGKTLALDENSLKAVLNSVNAPEPISVESAVEALGGNTKTYRSNGKEAPTDPDLGEYHFLCSFERLKLQNEQPVDRYGNPQPFEVTAYYPALADLSIEDMANTMMMVYNPESGEVALIQLEAANLNNSNELKVSIPFPGLFAFIQK